jgi:outer membrane immunogenic protein
MPSPFPKAPILKTRERDQEKPMNKLLLVAAGAIALGLTSQASAADLAARPYTKAPPLVAPIYNWSGFYAGINGGGGTSHNCWDYVFGPAAVPLLGPIYPEGCHDSTGGTVGGQVGYRWQSTNWVFGLEAQGNWADFSGSNVTPIGGNPLGGGGTITTKIDAFGLFTGQVGYAWNNVLAYVKGGAAVVDFKYNDFLAPFPAATGTQTRWGGTVGAGLEIGFAPNWSVAFEYDHIFLDESHPSITSPGLTFPLNVRSDVDMGTVRVNYRFGGPVVAKY